VRLVRFAAVEGRRLPTQIDYADYRDVAGVKLPFRWTVTGCWCGHFELTEVRRMSDRCGEVASGRAVATLKAQLSDSDSNSELRVESREL